MVVVTDQSTATELAEVIGHVNELAKHSTRLLGSSDRPTDWDRHHELLDAMLTDWECRSARELEQLSQVGQP